MHCIVMSWDVLCTCQQKSNGHSQLFVSKRTMKNDSSMYEVFRQYSMTTLHNTFKGVVNGS